jgi:uncharacterized membrane protein
MWILFAGLSALADSLRNLFSKREVSKRDPIIVALATFAYALPLYTVLVFFKGVPHLGSNYWWALLVHVVADFVTYIMLTNALKSSPISLVVPLLSFTSLVALVTAPFMVGDYPTATGVVGVVIILVGTYLLNFTSTQKDFLAPLRALWQEKGSRLALLVACIWGFTNNFAKIAVENSNPMFHLLLQSALICVLYLGLLAIKGKLQLLGSLKNKPFNLALVGVAAGLAVLFELIAYNLPGGLIAYVVSLKRLSLLLSVVYGVVLFKEKQARGRILATAIMLIGVVLIVVGG